MRIAKDRIAELEAELAKALSENKGAQSAYKRIERSRNHWEKLSNDCNKHLIERTSQLAEANATIERLCRSERRGDGE